MGALNGFRGLRNRTVSPLLSPCRSILGLGIMWVLVTRRDKPIRRLLSPFSLILGALKSGSHCIAGPPGGLVVNLERY